MTSQATAELAHDRQVKAAKEFPTLMNEMVESYIRSIKKSNPQFTVTDAFEKKLRTEIDDRLSSLTS